MCVGEVHLSHFQGQAPPCLLLGTKAGWGGGSCPPREVHASGRAAARAILLLLLSGCTELAV